MLKPLYDYAMRYQVHSKFRPPANARKLTIQVLSALPAEEKQESIDA